MATMKPVSASAPKKAMYMPSCMVGRGFGKSIGLTKFQTAKSRESAGSRNPSGILLFASSAVPAK